MFDLSFGDARILIALGVFQRLNSPNKFRILYLYFHFKGEFHKERETFGEIKKKLPCMIFYVNRNIIIY